MAQLGSLFYTVGLKDMTDSDLQRIEQKLQKLGVNIDVSSLRTNIEKELANSPVKITFDPLITSSQIEDKLKGQVVRTEIAPLTGNLVSNINAALKGQDIWIDGIKVDPEKLREITRTSLQGQGFESVGASIGDSVAKSVKERLEGTQTAHVQIDIKKFSDSILTAIQKAEAKEFKLKWESKDFRDKLESAVRNGIKVTIDPQITSAAIEQKLAGHVIKAEITPLVTTLKQSIKNACAGGVEVEIGPNEPKLYNLIQGVLRSRGFILTINTVTGLDNAIKTVTNAGHKVTLSVDAAQLANSLKNTLSNFQSNAFGLTVAKKVLYDSIEGALKNHPFDIQIRVMQNQARAAVQNALNKAANITPTNALTYQRLQAGEYKAAQASLARTREAQLSAASAAKAHASASVNLGGAMGSNIRIAGELGAAMASLYSVHAAKEFLSNVIEIGGELEHQKIAMDTIFGDKGKTAELFGQIKDLARHSPFGVMELTKSVKALSAYGVKYNEIYDTAKRLADISAATSVDINRLILAFGKTKSRGFLDGLEAKQFAYANIPIYEMVRKKLEELEHQSVTTAEVMARMKKREISFDIVKDVLWDITDEGGQFYNMQEALAGSVKTSWKLVKDNIELMFGELAEGSIGKGLKGVAEILQGLTREWRTISAVVGTAAAALGVYKLAQFGCNQVMTQGTQALYANIMAEHQKRIESTVALGVTQKLTAADLELINSRNMLTNGELEACVANKMLNYVHLQQLYITKKVTAAQIEYLYSIGAITAAEKKAILGTTRLKASLNGLGLAIRKVGAALKALLLNPWTIAITAFSAIAGLIAKSNEQSERAKEIGKTMFDKAVDGAKSLHETLKAVGDDIDNLAANKIAEAIDKFENAIRDYDPNAEMTIRNARYDENGNIRKDVDYAKQLQERIKLIEQANKLAEDIHIDLIVGNAIDETGGWFDDNLTEDLKDYAESYNNLQKDITKYLTSNRLLAEELVSIASEDADFKLDIQGLETLDSKFSILINNLTKYPKVLEQIQNIAASISDMELSDMIGSVTGKQGLYNSIFASSVKKSKDKALEELGDFMDNLQSYLSQRKIKLGKDMEESTKIMLSNVAAQVFEVINNLPIEMQAPFRDMFNETLGLDFDNAAIFGALSQSYGEKLQESCQSAYDKLKSGQGMDSLSEIERKNVEKALEDAATELKRKYPELEKEINAAIGSMQFRANIFMSLNGNENIADWKRYIIEKLDTDNPLKQKIIMAADIPAMQKNIREAVATAKKEMKNLESMVIPMGIKLTGNKIDPKNVPGYYINPLLQQQVDEYNKWIDILKGANEIGKVAGFDPNYDPNKKQKGKSEDKVAKKFRQEFKDIKDAWSEFQKWQKTLGTEGAAQKVAESGLFSTLSPDMIPKTAQEYEKLIKDLRTRLEKAGIKGHDQRESLLNEILKQILDINKSQIDENLKLALDEVSRIAEQELQNWDIYDKLRKATGNQELAMQVAFGMSGGETDYEKMVKDQYNDLAYAYKQKAPDANTMMFEQVSYDNLKDLPSELQKAWEDAVKKINDYRKTQREIVADAVANYKSSLAEIEKLQSEANEKIAKIKDAVANGKLSSAKGENIIGQINAELDFEKLKRSSDYLKFFNSALSLSLPTAERIGRSIQDKLNKQLQQGTITAKDFAEEMAKIRSTVDKIKQSGKSNFFNYLKGGIDGVYQNKREKAQNDYDSAAIDYQDAQDKYQKALEDGDVSAQLQARLAMGAAEAQMNGAKHTLDAVDGVLQSLDVMDVFVKSIGDFVQGIVESFNLIKDMADSFGVDTGADSGWGEAAAYFEAITSVTEGLSKVAESAKSGSIGGMLSGLVSVFTNPFTIFNKHHDEKLDEKIEKSKQYLDVLNNINDAIERRMEYFLGNGKYLKLDAVEQDIARLDQLRADAARINGRGKDKYADEINKLTARKRAYQSGGAYGYQRQLMEEQLAELEYQRKLEEDKKKSDTSAIEDYNSQIDEMQQSIRDFAEEMADTLYGINLKDWASQLGDSLYEAWKKGEDGAEAFKKKAGEILGDVMNNILKLSILEPLMEDVQTYLFGKDGKSGAFGSDFELDNSEIETLAGKVMKGMEGVDAYTSALDTLEKVLNDKYGITMKGDESANSDNSLTLQGLTEETGGLIASYLNAIRASVAHLELNDISTSEYIKQIAADSLPQLTALSQAQLQLQQQIVNNTGRNAVAAEEIHRILKNNIAGGNRFNF